MMRNFVSQLVVGNSKNFVFPVVGSGECCTVRSCLEIC